MIFMLPEGIRPAESKPEMIAAGTARRPRATITLRIITRVTTTRMIMWIMTMTHIVHASTVLIIHSTTWVITALFIIHSGTIHFGLIQCGATTPGLAQALVLVSGHAGMAAGAGTHGADTPDFIAAGITRFMQEAGTGMLMADIGTGIMVDMRAATMAAIMQALDTAHVQA